LPHTKSTKKRLRTSKIRRERNRDNRAEIRTVLKKFRELSGAEERKDALPNIYSMLDTHVKKGIIPKERASRLKSRAASLAQK